MIFLCVSFGEMARCVSKGNVVAGFLKWLRKQGLSQLEGCHCFQVSNRSRVNYNYHRWLFAKNLGEINSKCTQRKKKHCKVVIRCINKQRRH